MSMKILDNPAVGAYCDWFDLFTNLERGWLEDGLRISGQIASVICILFFVYMWYRKGGVLARKPQSLDSYRNLQIYFYAIYLRNAVYMLTNMSSVRGFVRQYFDECHFFAFWETFTGVLEMETITHVCVERYVVAKYITHGWPIPKEHYNMYFYLSLMFACVFGYFYDSDFSGCMCTYQLVLPDSLKKSFTVGIFLLRSVKPTAVMIGMLSWACWMEKRFNSAQKKLADFEFTEIIFAITSVNLVCWIPFSTIRGWVLLCQFFLKEPVPLPAPLYLRYAIWMHFMAPTFTLIVVVLVDIFALPTKTAPRIRASHDKRA